MKKIALLTALLTVTGSVAAEDTRTLVTIEPGPADKFVYNYGPTQGRSVITTALRNAAGEVIGECHTLFYGYTTSRQEVEGFSCTTKK